MTQLIDFKSVANKSKNPNQFLNKTKNIKDVNPKAADWFYSSYCFNGMITQQEAAKELYEDIKNGLILNRHNHQRLKIGEAIYIKETNSIGRVIDGGSEEIWNDTCRTYGGVRSFDQIERLRPGHFKYKGVTIPNSFNRDKERYNPERIRNTAPGYIGGSDIAEHASDGEVIMITEKNDYLAKLHNSGKHDSNSYSHYKEWVEMTKESIRNRIKQTA